MLTNEKPHFNLKETCKYLGLSQSAVYKLTHHRLISHYKPNGKMIYFLKEDLDQFIRKNRIKTHDELIQIANYKKGIN